MIARAKACGRTYACYFGDLKKAFDKVATDKVQANVTALTPPGALRRELLDRQRRLTTRIRVEDATSEYQLPRGLVGTH